MMNLKETVELLMDPTKKRPESIIVDEKPYLYNDSRKEYQLVPEDENKKPFCRTVCNVDSFARAVLEEDKRRSDEDHKNGFRRTVIFKESGAVFYVDDQQRVKQDKWLFERAFTHLWEAVLQIVNGDLLSHKDLIFVLDSVRKHIPGYSALHHTITKLRISKNVNFISDPIFSGGEQRGSFTWEQTVDSSNATERAVCPSEIPFKGKIVRGSSIEYEFALQLTPVLDDKNGSIYFSLTLPGLEMVIDQIREDEYQAFCKQVESLENLLILRNY